MADRHGHARQGGDAAGQVVPHRAADVDGASAGPALRRAADGAGRLPRPALLLDRVLAARRGWGRAHDRLARRRRGLALFPRRGGRGRPGRAARAVCVLLRLARRVARAPDRRRLGRRPADGDAAPPPPDDARACDEARLLGAHGRGRDLRGRARRGDAAHLHARAARRLERPHGPDRRRADRVRWAPGLHGLRLRDERLRRVRGRARARRRGSIRGRCGPSASARAADLS